MRRILVAQSVGLWIRLNRHLSGVSAVDLVETPTLEGGRLLAQLERPSLVVFGTDAAHADAESLVAVLEEQGCDTRVVLVSERLPATPRPLPPGGCGLVLCTADGLVSVVTELLAQCERPDENLDLLVHYRTECESGPRDGFVVVLDLDEKSLLLQADQALDVGQDLQLDFVLPGDAEGAARSAVRLACTVAASEQAADLVFNASISSIDGPALDAVRRFLGDRRAGRDRS